MKTKNLSHWTVGIDLGDLRHAICVLDRRGEIIEERTITNRRESLRRLAKKYPKARVADMAKSIVKSRDCWCC